MLQVNNECIDIYMPGVGLIGLLFNCSFDEKLSKQSEKGGVSLSKVNT